MAEKALKFLPYQADYINDHSRFKIVEKSRRTGFTFAQSYEDVEYACTRDNDKVFFSSKDDSAAFEYIDYCGFFIKKTFHRIGEYIGQEIIDPDRDIKAHVIRFKNGSRINALTSNPGRLRSKGGKVVLDEFAFHDSQEELYAAAYGSIMRNDILRILSTYNGKQNLYYRLVQRVKKGELKWGFHSVPIHKAVEQGLYDQIIGRPTTQAERDEWIHDLRVNALSEEMFLQEFCCIPADSKAAFMPYDLIMPCVRSDILFESAEKLREVKEFYVGIDIGRKKDLTVIWIDEKNEFGMITRLVIELENMKFSAQKQVIWPILALPGMRRACIDETGIGMQLAEEAEEAFGSYKIEKVTFTGPVKQDMAYRTRRYFEDIRTLIPDDEKIHYDFNKVKKVTTAAGNIRFDAQRDEDGHADRFWAKSLCLLAGDDHDSGPVEFTSSHRRESYNILQKY